MGHVDIFFSNYYNLQSVYFEFIYKEKDPLEFVICLKGKLRAVSKISNLKSNA